MSIPFPRVEIERNYTFRAWHHLPNAGNPMARNPHWHDYSLTLIIDSECNPNTNGCAFDFDELDKHMARMLGKLDGCDLNQMLPVPPTSEMVAAWCLANMPGWLTGVRVSEGERSSATIRRKGLPSQWATKFKAVETL